MNICLLRGLIMGRFKRGILGQWGGVCRGHRRMMVCFGVVLFVFRGKKLYFIVCNNLPSLPPPPQVWSWVFLGILAIPSLPLVDVTVKLKLGWSKIQRTC